MSYSRFTLSALIAVAFALQLSVAHAKTVVDGIALIVNESIVTLSEYNRKEERIKRREPRSPKEEIVNTIISEILINQEAGKNGISVSERELEAAVDGFRKSLNLDDAGFAKMLVEKNITLKDFSHDMRLQILTNKLVENEVARKRISIDDKTIEDAYMQTNPDADRSAQVKIAHILMPDESKNSLAEAEKIAKRAKSGEESFAALAKKHSVEARTADRGGNLGYFKYDQLIGPLQKAVEGANVGDINGPVLSKSGFHIVKVLAIKQEGILVPLEIKNSLIEQIAMQKTEQILLSIIEKGFKNSYIEIKI